ncbi:MAG TPA: LamG-like jellyroll fold domain-containing protein, partial [Aggregatilineales bacterium]|nr:LamG-like jellyroll fold domain-containing protein [Aggregatilineales bacterium]
AIKPDKHNDWEYGIGVRGRDVGRSNGFYYLAVIGDGSWEFDVHPKANTVNTITSGKLKSFKPDAAVKLRIVANGSHFDLYVNGAKVGEADDSSLDSVDDNQIILLAGTFTNTPSQLVKFTHLNVDTP